MVQIITFLGKGGVGCTTVAIATAKKLASLGQRVLLVGLDPSPSFGMVLGLSPEPQPQSIGPNLSGVQLQPLLLLEEGWEELKQLEAKYLRSPTLNNIYGQELGLLPGMDEALVLRALWDYRQSKQYDVIVVDGDHGLRTLRMLGTPEILSWYVRRFRQVFGDSDIGKALSPFIQPVTSAILNVSWNADNFAKEPTEQANQVVEEGKSAIEDPQQVIAYLVTNGTSDGIATAKYLWGSSQQIGLTIGGVLLNQETVTNDIVTAFSPLEVTSLPTRTESDWQALIDALPNLGQVAEVPQPVTVDLDAREVRLFLPSFDKKQVKLTQYGPEITIEAGNQRHNLDLPVQLQGQGVKGAKFQNQYLIISF